MLFFQKVAIRIFEILYTPAIMVVAQIVIILPIIISINTENLEALYREYEDYLKFLMQKKLTK